MGVGEGVTEGDGLGEGDRLELCDGKGVRDAVEDCV